MRSLQNVTLIGADCVDIDRLLLAADISTISVSFGDIKMLTSLPSPDSRVVQIPHLGSVEAYSDFCVKDLHRYVDTDFALIIQHDGFILNPNAWSEEFLKYDYIGAPWLVKDWSVEKFNFPKEMLDTLQVGNGGFSLRSKRFLETSAQLFEQGFISNCHPEDVVLAIHHRRDFDERGLNFAPPEVASRFSFEALDDEHNAWSDEFGFHGLRWTDISVWLDQHPEYKNQIDNTIS